MRMKAVSFEAFSWVIQEGAYYRTGIIQKLLQQNSFYLNKTFSFGKFIIDGEMLMPTVLEAERIFIKDGKRKARSVNMSYTLDKSPEIVSGIPSWRDYLLRVIPKPKDPISYAYPKNKDEVKVWDIEFGRGFTAGVRQANRIYSNDLSRAHSDITGYYRFRFLLAQNIVTLPVLNKHRAGVMLLDSGKTINLIDVKYTITLDSRYNKVNEWKPVFFRGDAHE